MTQDAEAVTTRLREIRDRLLKSTPEPLKRNRYDHGGGRMFRDGEAGDRVLVADCYDEGDREFYFHARDDIGFLAQIVADLTDVLSAKSEVEGRLALPAWQPIELEIVKLRAALRMILVTDCGVECAQIAREALAPPPAAEGEPSLVKDDFTPLANVNEMGTGNLK